MTNLQIVVDGKTVLDRDIESVTIGEADDGGIRLYSPIPDGHTICYSQKATDKEFRE